MFCPRAGQIENERTALKGRAPDATVLIFLHFLNFGADSFGSGPHPSFLKNLP
jgi:hypothetical protein